MRPRWIRDAGGWREVELLLTCFRWLVVAYAVALYGVGVLAVGRPWILPVLLLLIGYVGIIQFVVLFWYAPHRAVIIAFLDACVISIAVFGTGGSESPLTWLYFFVLIGAAVRFRLTYSALIAAVAIVGFATAVAAQPLYVPERDATMAWSRVLVLVLATIFAWLVANAVTRQRRAADVAQTELREARRRSDEWQAMFELGGQLALARSVPAALATGVAGTLALTKRPAAGAFVQGGRRSDGLVIATCHQGGQVQITQREPPTADFEEHVADIRTFATATGLRALKQRLDGLLGFEIAGVAPLEIEGETAGLLMVSNGDPLAVGEREILQQIGHELANTIERVGLLARERRRAASLSVLCQVSRTIGASLNVNEVLDAATASGIVLLMSDAAACALRDQDGQLRVRAARGLSDEYLTALAATDGSLLADLVATDGQPVAIADLAALASPAAQLARSAGLRSYLGVPVRKGGVTIGVVEVFGRGRPRRWTPEDVELLTALADQAAVAADNARLFEAERDTVLKLKQLEAHRADFVALLTHELRTPVTSIKGYGQLLQRRAAGDPKAVQYAEVIVERTNHLAELIDHILELSELENGLITLSKQPVQLRPLLEAIIASYGERHDTPIRERLSENLPIVRADPQRVEQIVTTLLTSARRGAPAAPLEVGARPDDEGVIVWVREMSRAAVPVLPESLFEPLRPGEPSESGLPRDLSLYVTRSFIEAHGGKIWLAVEDDGSHGYYFKLYC